MKEFLSLFTFGIGAFCFVVFFAALKPAAITAAVGGQARPSQHETFAYARLPPQLFAAALRPAVGRQ
jgi:hypothetical protein